MPTEQRGPGRPPHIPNDDTRSRAAEIVAGGGTVADVADALGLSEPTVRLHYADEIRDARPQQIFPFLETAPSAPRQPRPPAGGMRPHRPTRASRERVEILAAAGMPARGIAKALGISEPTLRLHYADNIQDGRYVRDAEIIEAQFKAAKEGNVSAQKAWLARPRDLVDPIAPAPDAPAASHLGKKEAAQAAAFDAQAGTGWEGLLPH